MIFFHFPKNLVQSASTNVYMIAYRHTAPTGLRMGASAFIFYELRSCL